MPHTTLDDVVLWASLQYSIISIETTEATTPEQKAFSLGRKAAVMELLALLDNKQQSED